MKEKIEKCPRQVLPPVRDILLLPFYNVFEFSWYYISVGFIYRFFNYFFTVTVLTAEYSTQFPLVTLQRYLLPFIVLLAVNETVFVLFPAALLLCHVLPPSLLICHWYTATLDLDFTENTAVSPTFTFTFAGCLEITESVVRLNTLD